jgi:phage gpG-like protein
MSITVECEELLNYINDIKERGYRLRPILTNIGQIMLDSTEKNFESGGRPKWEPLKAITLILRSHYKRGIGRPRKGVFASGFVGGTDPLIFTGRLKNANRMKLYPNKVEVGPFGVDYAQVQQEGGFGVLFGKRTRIPARRFLRLTPEEKQQIREEVENYLLNSSNKLKRR